MTYHHPKVVRRRKTALEWLDSPGYWGPVQHMINYYDSEGYALDFDPAPGWEQYIDNHHTRPMFSVLPDNDCGCDLRDECWFGGRTPGYTKPPTEEELDRYVAEGHFPPLDFDTLKPVRPNQLINKQQGGT